MFGIGVQEVRRRVEKFSLDQNTLETVCYRLFHHNLISFLLHKF